jgi:hypothetical protein
VHNFWQAAESDANQLPVALSVNQLDPAAYNITHILRRYPGGSRTITPPPDRVTVRILLQPIGIDVLDELAGKTADGVAPAVQDLDPAIIERMPLFSVLAKTLEWTPETATVNEPDKQFTRSCSTLAYRIDSTAYPYPTHQKASCSP